MDEETVYRDFIRWLNQTWFTLRETEELLPLIRARYTPDEAALLTGVPFSTKRLDELATIKGADAVSLGSQLDTLAQKGLVYRSVKDEHVRYRLNDAFFVFLRSTFWPGRSDRVSKATAPLVNRYYYGGFFDQYEHAHYKGLRSVPIQGTIEDTRRVMPYEDVVAIVNEQDYWSVSHCPCRHRKNIDPDSPGCSYPTEVCLHFGSLGRYIVANVMGREIGREKTLGILRSCAEAGLVHGVSNWRERVDTICNCCKCCCLWLEAFHRLKHSRSLDPSNYRVRIEPERCKGCGLCVKRCPMEALRLEEAAEAQNKTGEVARLAPDRCIGCGVCVYKCPGGALTLEEREEIQEPPKDAREYAILYATDRTAALARQRKEEPESTK